MSSQTRVDSLERVVALTRMFTECRGRLLNMVRRNMSPIVRGRLDPADVLQDSFLEISRRIDSYYAQTEVPFYVWARQITRQTLALAHRKHLGVKKRDASMETRFPGRTHADSASAPTATPPIEPSRSPSQRAIFQERVMRVRDAISKLDELDRDVIMLRHFHHLSNQEVANRLAISKTAASNRYVRAIQRLRSKLRDSRAND